MELLGARVRLNPRPARRRRPALEAAMLGHCPGKARLERLLALDDALAMMRRCGFGTAVDALQGTPDAIEAQLYHLPIPLQSTAEFDDVFPDARSGTTAYRSLLAGDRAWLPSAVTDFFANGGERLWVVRIPEDEGQAGFFPAEQTILHDVRTLRGLALALVLQDVGVVALPDLERLQIPARLADVPRVRLANPEPTFLPCTADLEDSHRERRHSEEMPSAPEPVAIADVLERLQADLARFRPDLQCLYSLPLSYSREAGGPVADAAALRAIETMKAGRSGPGLRRIQFLYPYLRDLEGRLGSTAGLIAGMQAGGARRRGVWRSVAGTPMITAARPYPKVSVYEAVALREAPGVGVILERDGDLLLDDERLTVPALHRGAWEDTEDPGRFDGYRAGEVQRFLGFLLRQLQALGEVMVFNTDFRDPRPRLLLDRFFRELHSAGALRGALPEQAFAIRERQPQPGAVVFDIEIAPAFPIDKVHLTFANRSGEWQTELAHV